MTTGTSQELATPATLGAPGGRPDTPPEPDARLKYFADGSFYAALGGFLLPGVTLFWIGGFIWDSDSAIVFASVPALFFLLGPAAIVLGVLAQRLPRVHWRNRTAWAGIILGVVDTIAYGTIFAALLGFVA